MIVNYLGNLIILTFFSGSIMMNSSQDSTNTESIPYSTHDNYYSYIIDSLSQYLKDTTTVYEAKILCEIGSGYYRNFNFEEGINVAKKALKIAYPENDTAVITKTLRLFADNYYAMGDYQQSNNYFLKELEYYSNTENNKKVAEVYCNVGVNFEERGLMEQGMYYYLEALKIYEKIDDKEGIVAALSNLSFVYRYQDNFTKAIDALEKANSIEKEYLSKSLQKEHYYFVNIADVYIKMNQLEDAMKYLVQGENILKKITIPDDEDLNIWVELLRFEGDIYVQQNNTPAAYKKYSEALSLSKKTGYLEKQGKVLKSLAEMMLTENKNNEAETYSKEGLKIADQTGSLYLKKDIYELLSQIAKNKKNYQNAYKYQQLYNVFSDSVLSIETAKQLANFQAIYETEKKENQIQLLEKEKRIQDLQLQKTESQKNYLIIVLVLLLSLGLIIFNRFRMKKRVASELSTLNATKDKFFAIIAHDLKNPVSAFNQITQQVNTHFEKLDEEELKYYVGVLSDNSSSLLQLLKNLLAWSRSQRNQLVPVLKETQSEKLITNVVEDAKNQANSKNIKILTAETESIVVLTDKDIVETVLRNLLGNAIKFSPENSGVEISTKQKEDELIISITDQGPGLSHEDIKKLFRIEIDTKTIGSSENKGSGIGLIICYEFLKKINGRIWAESEPGNGCVFSIALPLKRK